MKILLLGDASNYHHILSIGLKRAGHDVTVASNGSTWMHTSRDIDISRSRSKIGGALLWAKLNSILSSRLKGYDVVQIHNPIFLDLRPERVKVIFDRLRRDNGAVCLTMLGTDSPFVDMCMAPDCPLKYSEFSAFGHPTPYTINHADTIAAYQSTMLRDHCQYVYDRIDGAVTALYEYHLTGERHLPPEKLAYGGIPIDTRAIPYTPVNFSSVPLRMLIACHKGRESEKGMDLLMPVVNEVAQRNSGKIVVDLVQGLPLSEFSRRLEAAHIVVDQLYSYTPATTALMAMASGKIVMSGGEEDFYRFIGEEKMRPILNVAPDNVAEAANMLQHLIDHRDACQALSEQGRLFVEKHNDTDVVASRFINFWEKIREC